MPDVRPWGATLGAEVHDVDLRRLDDAGWKEIEAAFHEFAVLAFPGQHLSDEEQVAFGDRFGPPERLITKRAEDPKVGVLANVDGEGRVVDAGSTVDLFLEGNNFWHTDSSYKPVPAKASMLSARVLPSTGGETGFADMRAAWDALDPEEQARLEGLEAIHDYRYSQGLVGGLDILTDEEWAALPPVAQPLVRQHPATGRNSLYIGRHASHVVGMPVEEGRAWLARLLEEACRPPRVFEYTWSVGDLVVWDNRCVLHRGRPWPKHEPRVMNRTTIAGDGANDWLL